MLNADLYLNELKIIFFTYFANRLLRAFPDSVVGKDFLSMFRTLNQVIAGITNHMTRSLYYHASLMSYITARDYSG